MVEGAVRSMVMRFFGGVRDVVRDYAEEVARVEELGCSWRRGRCLFCGGFRCDFCGCGNGLGDYGGDCADDVAGYVDDLEGF